MVYFYIYLGFVDCARGGKERNRNQSFSFSILLSAEWVDSLSLTLRRQCEFLFIGDRVLVRQREGELSTSLSDLDLYSADIESISAIFLEEICILRGLGKLRTHLTRCRRFKHLRYTLPHKCFVVDFRVAVCY